MTENDTPTTATRPDEAAPQSPPSSAVESPAETSTAAAPARSHAVWYVVAAILAVALIAGIAFMAGRGSRGEASPSGASSGTPKTIANETTSKPAPPSPSLSPTPGVGSKGASGTVKPPAPSTVRPTAPAAAGSKLTTITTPPNRTLAMLAASSLPEDARYRITFEPFGTARLSGDGLVIAIKTAEPLNASAKTKSFAGRTAFALYGDASTDVTTGGTYTAELGFRKTGETLSLVLYKIALQK